MTCSGKAALLEVRGVKNLVQKLKDGTLPLSSIGISFYDKLLIKMKGIHEQVPNTHQKYPHSSVILAMVYRCNQWTCPTRNHIGYQD